MNRQAQKGFTLIEALIAMVVLAIGLLGVAKLQSSTRQFEMESYQRAQAVILLQDMAGRLAANRAAAQCYAVTTNTTAGSPWVGTGYSSTPACTVGTINQQNTAVADLTEWDRQLKGASETAGGTSVGAMIGARGCITYDATNDYYLISIAWQGLMQTGVPAGLTCAKDQFGQDTQRRVVSTIVRFGVLT